MDVYLGSILLFAGTFQIRGFTYCNGQLLPIAQNTALFALLGTTYGGNGQTTFALPDLRSRVPIHFGQGNGLSNYNLGQSSGSETVTLTQQQMPQHNHLINAQNGTGAIASPAGNFLATTGVPRSTTTYDTYVSSVTAAATLNTNAVSFAGASQSHSNLQPYLALSFQIALQGIFPSRN